MFTDNIDLVLSNNTEKAIAYYDNVPGNMHVLCIHAKVGKETYKIPVCIHRKAGSFREDILKFVKTHGDINFT